jgi:hypothetical protein
MALLRIDTLSRFGLFLALVAAPLWAQEEEVVPAEKAAAPPIAITFTPPDLMGSIVLGIFDAQGKLVRTLPYEWGDPDLQVDTNGYIASWDGLDESGKPCPGGRYAARGYVVGQRVDVSGEAFHFNDWVAQDKIPATGVKLRRWPDALGVELTTAAGPVFGKIRLDGTLDQTTEPAALADEKARWGIVDDEGQKVVVQFGKEEESERALRVPKDEPQPEAVLAAEGDNQILLLESAPGGIERVRLLVRGDKAEQKDGKVVADWEVAFERTLQPCANFGIVEGRLVADVGTAKPEDTFTVTLAENSLQPGERVRLELSPVATHPGTALVTSTGLKLFEISSDGNWDRFALGTATDSKVVLYQGDGIVVEEFAITGLDQIAAFDAGTFLLAAPAQ